MVSAPAEYFDRLISEFTAAFEDAAVVVRDERPTRSILEITGRFARYRIRLLEVIIPPDDRKYAYYVLQGGRVVAGFDNAADPQALKLKYGPKYTEHRLERIPHRHTEDKAGLELTEEIRGTAFIAWVQANLSAR